MSDGFGSWPRRNDIITGSAVKKCNDRGIRGGRGGGRPREYLSKKIFIIASLAGGAFFRGFGRR